MNMFQVMGFISTIAMVLPIIVLSLSGLARYRSFPALLIYYVIVVSYNLSLLGFVDGGKDYRYYLGVCCNLLDTPLMLFFLLYFSKTIFFKRKMQVIIGLFLAFEVIATCLYGFNARAAMIVLGPGLVLVLGLSLLFFIHQVKIAVLHHKAVGKAIMVSSVLFTYVGYCFVYAVYYVIQPAFKDDAHLVYFLINILASITMAAGIYAERIRVKHLAELQTTREELKSIYQDERSGKKMTAPKEAVIFNFDKHRLS